MGKASPAESQEGGRRRRPQMTRRTQIGRSEADLRPLRHLWSSPSALFQLDLPGLRDFALLDGHREPAILVLGFDLVTIDVLRHPQRPRKASTDALGGKD